MRKISIPVLMIILFFLGCSSNEKINKDDKELETDEIYSPELNVKFKEVYSWINLMPGPDAEPRFNITGEIELYKSEDYNLSSLVLTLINIYQSDELIYNITPQVRIDEKLSTEEMKFLIFSTTKGMLIDQKLNTESVIDAKFIFEQNDIQYSYLIKNVKIDKAY